MDRYVLPSTDGPVEHVKVQCLGRHWFVLPAAALPPVRTVTARGRDGAGPMNANLTNRDRAILRAVAGGTAELLVSSQPDLFVDGRFCCDQLAARRLAHAGLIAGARPGDDRPARAGPADRGRAPGAARRLTGRRPHGAARA